MIELYSGTPGSGKSLHAAQTVYYRLRAGRPVIANFQIEPGYIRKYRNTFYYCPNDKLCPEVLYDFAVSYFGEEGHQYKEDSILLVIDEAQLLFNARSWCDRDRGRWLSFFTQHRKYGYLVIIIAQNDRMLDRQVRAVIEYEEVHRKISNYGKLGSALKVVFLRDVFICIRRWYPLKERTDYHLFFANKKYYRLYDTRAIFDFAGNNGIRSSSSERQIKA